MPKSDKWLTNLTQDEELDAVMRELSPEYNEAVNSIAHPAFYKV